MFRIEPASSAKPCLLEENGRILPIYPYSYLVRNFYLVVLFLKKEILGSKETFRGNDSSTLTYHDKMFDNEMNCLIRATDEHYSNMMYREATKTGFYDLQTVRDNYRDLTANDGGMNWRLVEKFIEVHVIRTATHV